MDYLKCSFPVSEREHRDRLLVSLIDLDFQGFEEDASFLYAYAPFSKTLIDTADRIGQELGVPGPVRHERIQDQNWNARWESEFTPVVVDDFCTIRAAFHEISVTTSYEIIITPKMSFGTGHHDTTRLMIARMRQTPFQGKKVLDFGTGTGVLAILAAKLGASTVHAVDNDVWAYENAQENIAVNGCPDITIVHGTLGSIPPGSYDIILANINRHILLETMPELYRKLLPGGRVLMSGLLLQDADIVCEAAAAAGFVLHERQTGNNWLLLEFEKVIV